MAGLYFSPIVISFCINLRPPAALPTRRPVRSLRARGQCAGAVVLLTESELTTANSTPNQAVSFHLPFTLQVAR